MQWLLSTMIIILVSLMNVFGQKTHECIHDQLEHQPPHLQHVNYNNHPFERIDNDTADTEPHRRQLIQDTDYKPIRISPYYDPVTIDKLSNDKKLYIKQLISASIRYFQSFVRVVPVDGPLFVTPCSNIRRALDGSFLYHFCSTTINDKCGSIATIPEGHMSEIWAPRRDTDYSSDSEQLYKAKGYGIKDTDLVIYVSSTEKECSSHTLAYTMTCNRDQYGRPTAGAINFCPRTLKKQFWKMDVMTTLHELTHILIMSQIHFGSFYDSKSGAFLSKNKVWKSASESDTDNDWIISPKVKETAQEHFGCDSLDGAPLENSGGEGTAGNHWSAKHLNFEYMIGTTFSAQEYVSKFTLALMEDSSWYKVDYNYAETFTWGQNEGCTFFTADCVNKTTQTANFPKYWCDGARGEDKGCSADYTTIAECLWSKSGSSVPAKFQYYSDNRVGRELYDHCAFREPIEVTSDFQQICWDIRGNKLDKNSVERSRYGVDSRCVNVITYSTVIHKLLQSPQQKGFCFKHECTGYHSRQYSAVNITINGETVVNCTRGEFGTRKPIKAGKVTSVICPNVDAICGSSSKPFECVWGEYNDDLQECVCSAGYKGSVCDEKDTELVIQAELADDSSSSHTIHCIQHKGVNLSGLGIFDGYYAYYRENEGIESFYNAKIKHYLYFIRVSSAWAISDEFNDLRPYAYCQQAVENDGNPDVTKCNKWYNKRGVLPNGAKAVYTDNDGGCGIDVKGVCICGISEGWEFNGYYKYYEQGVFYNKEANTGSGAYLRFSPFNSEWAVLPQLQEAFRMIYCKQDVANDIDGNPDITKCIKWYNNRDVLQSKAKVFYIDDESECGNHQ